jgi:hypothetical protein
MSTSLVLGWQTRHCRPWTAAGGRTEVCSTCLLRNKRPYLSAYIMCNGNHTTGLRSEEENLSAITSCKSSRRLFPRAASAFGCGNAVRGGGCGRCNRDDLRRLLAGRRVEWIHVTFRRTISWDLVSEDEQDSVDSTGLHPSESCGLEL